MITLPSLLKTKAKKMLVEHEGLRRRVYKDSRGILTIGIGRNVQERDLSDDVIYLMFAEDIDYFYDYLVNTYPWYSKLDENRQLALLDMCFMGTKKFEQFVKMLNYLSKSDYKNASAELLNSLYAQQVGKRAQDLAHILLTGEL